MIRPVALLALSLSFAAAARGDFEAAIKCPTSRCAALEFENGAKAGDPRSKLGWAILLEAAGKPREALKLYEEAADRGVEEAAFNAGVIYATGNGVAQSYVDADNFFRRYIAMGRRRLTEGRAPVIAKEERVHLGPWFQAYFYPFSPDLLVLPSEVADDIQSRAYLLASGAMLRRLMLFSQAPIADGRKITLTLFFRPSDLTVRMATDKQNEKYENDLLAKAKRAYGIAPIPYNLRKYSEDLATEVELVVPK